MRSSSVDSFAILAYLFKERGHDTVQALFERASAAHQRVLIAAPNWAEVCYRLQRKAGRSAWNEIREGLRKLPLEIVPVDGDLAEAAGDFKVPGGMSLADCFAAALAQKQGAELYTGDPDFHSVENLVKIVWL